MGLFLGIDGGQSSTTAVIGDETGRVLGMGRGGPCNHVAAPEGRAKFFHTIGECLALACRQAGLRPETIAFEAVCGGFSGGPADKELYLRELVRAQRYFLTTDALVALSGATAGEPGIITIAGTGSIAYGRNAARQVARAGGWGYVFGDEGGSFDSGRQALRAALRFEEGWGPPTILHSLLLERTGAVDANDLLHRFYRQEVSRPQIASFAALVDQAADAGDAIARAILHNAAQELATLTSAIRRQLFEGASHASVAPVGGLYRSRFVSERFRALVELQDGNEVIEPRYGPGAGALIEAYALAGLQPELSDVPAEKQMPSVGDGSD